MKEEVRVPTIRKQTKTSIPSLQNLTNSQLGILHPHPLFRSPVLTPLIPLPRNNNFSFLQMEVGKNE